VTYALLVVMAASGLLAAFWQAARAALVKERGEHQKTKGDLTAVSKALEISEAARKDETARLEAVIAAKKTEIATLEADTYACNSPALVRERLRSLLSSPTPAAPSGTPYGGVPK